MKEFKIEVPKGYEIDKEQSTFERIVFKEAKKGLPQSWEELEMISGAYITSELSSIGFANRCKTDKDDFKNVFPTRELAEAALAMAQLLQLRDRWNDGWIPDWISCDSKNTIAVYEDKVRVQYNISESHPLVFKSKELAEQFFAAPKIRELLEIAKPLL